MKTIFTILLLCLISLSFSQKNIFLGIEYGQNVDKPRQLNYLRDTYCVKGLNTPIDILNSNSIRLYTDVVFGLDSSKKHSFVKMIGAGVSKNTQNYYVYAPLNAICIEDGGVLSPPTGEFTYKTHSFDLDISSSLGVSSVFNRFRLNNSLGFNLSNSIFFYEIKNYENSRSPITSERYFEFTPFLGFDELIAILNANLYYSVGLNWGGVLKNKFGVSFYIPLFASNKTYLLYETYNVYQFQPRISLQIKL